MTRLIRLAGALLLTLLALPARAEIDIRQVTSPGGISAWLVEEPALPFVALEIRVRGGTALDLPGKRGAINLMTGLIEEGSGEMSAQEFQTELETLAATFEFRPFDDSIAISARFLTENRDEALALLRQALTRPRFDADAIERVRAQVESGIRANEKNPSRLAGSAFDALAFGAHPYATDQNGTLESVAALTREDLVAAHGAALSRDRIFVSAVGDITEGELGPLLDALLGDLPSEGPPLPDRIDYALPGGISIVPFETPQSVAVFGQRGLTRDDPDFFAAYVLNTILGGSSFESRLMREVREKRGLTYGVYTYLVPRDHTELMMGSVASANDRIADAIEVIRDQWAMLAEAGVTQEELDAAKTYLTGEYPLRFDGNGPIADIMVGMQVIGLPPDYVVNRNDFINAVTLADINRVAAELLDPEGLHFVVVGQPVGLAASQ